MSKMI